MKFTIRRGPKDIYCLYKYSRPRLRSNVALSLSLSLSLKREARGTKKRLNPVNRRNQHRNYLRFFHNQAATLMATGQYCLNLSIYLPLQSHLIYMYVCIVCFHVLQSVLEIAIVPFKSILGNREMVCFFCLILIF